MGIALYLKVKPVWKEAEYFREIVLKNHIFLFLKYKMDFILNEVLLNFLYGYFFFYESNKFLVSDSILTLA